jgi:hypothetical protein
MVLPSSIIPALQTLRAAFADRQELDRNIALKDALDWVDLKQPSSTSQPKAVVSQSRSGRSNRSGPGMKLNARDLKCKPPAMKIPRRIPRNVSNLVTWNKITVNSNLTTSTTAVSELNFAYSLNSHPAASLWTGLFDQWCIPAFSVSITTTMAPGSTSTMPKVYTALDWDSIVNINTISAIEQYSSMETVMLGPGEVKMVVRSVLPAIKTNSAQVGNAILLSTWCDTTQPSTNWYGIRTMIAPTSVAQTIDFDQTVYFAFRGPY